MSFNKTKTVLRAAAFGSLLLGTVLALTLSVSRAEAAAPTYHVSIDSSVLSGFTLSLSGTASSTKAAGTSADYDVQIDWGDGSVDDTSMHSFVDVGQDFSGTWSSDPDHTYTTSGSYTVKAKLYHNTPPGNESSGDSIDTVEVIIPPSPEDTLAECSDSLDNDEDGQADLADSGCASFRPVLTVVKTVVNDAAGTSVAADFTINVTGATTTSFAGSAGTPVVFYATGTYAVAESAAAGYAVSYSADCNGTMAVGDTKTCTVTNEDDAVPPTTGAIEIFKDVVAPNGGEVADATTFNLTLSGPEGFSSSTTFGEGLSAIFMNLVPGDYTIGELAQAGYQLIGISPATTTGVSAGATTTVTVTNRQISNTGELTVIKLVDNDENENATKSLPSDFNLYVDGFSVSSGVATTTAAGNHTVSEDPVEGYQASWSEGCDDGEIAVPVEGSATCTLTNTWVGTGKGELIVDKVVVGGDLSSEDFSLFVDGMGVTDEVATTTAAGEHTVTESTEADDEFYVASWSENCPNGVATVVSDESVTCTLTNTYTPPTTGTIIVTKNVIGAEFESDPEDPTLFTVEIGSGDFSTSTTFGEDADASFSDLEPGEYSVDEIEIPNGYELDSISDETIEVVAGETVYVAIVNRQLGTTGVVVIEKNVIDENDEDIADDTFFTVVIGGELGVSIAEGSPDTRELDLGSYSISENPQDGYELVSIEPSVIEPSLAGTTTIVVTNRRLAVSDGDSGSGEEERRSRRRSGRRSVGSVLGASTGDVLGASTDSCDLYIDSFLRLGQPNSPTQVEKLQTFLNEQIGAGLPVTGFFGPLTFGAVKRFQEANGSAVLGPWVDAGLLPNENVGTGYVYKTTRWFINHVKCEELAGNTPLVP